MGPFVRFGLLILVLVPLAFVLLVAFPFGQLGLGLWKASKDNESYEISKEGVYWIEYDAGPPDTSITRRKRPTSADPSTFKVLLASKYGQDRAAVFFKGKIIDGASTKTFRLLNTRYGVDATRVYFDGKAIDGADGGSFKLAGGPYGQDKSAVYYYDQRMETCSPQSFTYEGGPFSEDYALDEACAYVGSFRIPNIDRATFQFLRAGYSKDSAAVYWQAFRLDGADPKSFRVVEKARYGRDASACWSGAMRQKCLK